MEISPEIAAKIKDATLQVKAKYQADFDKMPVLDFVSQQISDTMRALGLMLHIRPREMRPVLLRLLDTTEAIDKVLDEYDVKRTKP